MIRLALVLFLAVVSVACTRFGPLGNKTVIDVNGQIMTASQFAEELTFRLREMDALSAKDSKFLQKTKDGIAEDFVVQALSSQWAKNNGVILKAEDVEAEINKARQGYPDNLAFQQGLAEQGLTYKGWRTRLEQSLLQKLVVKMIDEGLTKPSDAEVVAFYTAHKADFMEKESVQIRQIVLPTESDAIAIEEAMKHGRSLNSLIPKYSSQPQGQGAQNPAVMWVRKNESQIFDSAFKMKVGRKSPILKSEFGYHIFELLAHKVPKAKPIAEVKPAIQRILMEKTEQTAYLSWLDAQVRKARVYKDQEFINAMKVETKAD